MAVSGHTWTTEFVGDIIGSPMSAQDPHKLVADVEIAPAPTPDGIASWVRLVAPVDLWTDGLIGSDNARVHVVGVLWTTASGLIRCTPTSISRMSHA